MALAPAKKKGTTTPPFNPDPPVLGPNKYPGPQGRPVRTRSQNWDPQAWVQANKRPERSGGKPPQMEAMPMPGQIHKMPMPGPGGSFDNSKPTLDMGDTPYKPNWANPELQGGGGLNKIPDNFRGNIRDASMNRYPGVPDWGGSGGGMKRQPRGYGGDIKGMPGQGGEQVPGRAIGGSKPQLDMGDNAWGGGPRDARPMHTMRSGRYQGPVGEPVMRGPGSPGWGAQPQLPPQGAPAPDGRPGRQPLRPGMEYRPGGGQRPVGGGMRGAPQDGGGGQYQPQPVTGQALDDYNALQGGAAQWQQNGGQGLYSETTYPGQGQDPQQQRNEWRRRLMQMQQQGPMNNQYYGAF